MENNNINTIIEKPKRDWSIFFSSVFFVLGFIRSIIKLLKSRHQGHHHFSTPQALVLSWFLISLIPAIFSNGWVSDPQLLLIAVPAVYLLATEGIWWMANQFRDWHRREPSGNDFFSGLAVFLLLFATMLIEYQRYFNNFKF